MTVFDWYSQLLKPSWAPPAWLFGPVWTVLYAIIAITYGIVFYKFFTKKIPGIVALPFALNLVFNFAFSPIQFGFRSNFFAAIDILLLLVTLIWELIAIWKYSRSITYANIPYFFWALFATLLQLNITYLNW